MNPTELKLENILNSTDDNLNPLEPPKEDATPPPDPGTVVEPNNQDPPSDPPADNSNDQPSDPPQDDNKGSDDNEGFTANDVQETDETPEEKEPEVKPTPQNLDPETQYIVDNLPDISTTILVDGKPQEVSVKSWTQLPPDVEFASKRDELAFMNALTAQEAKARELQSEYRNNQQQQQVTEFEQREAQGIRDDISRLQTNGDLPKFKVKPDDEGFNDDPATKEVQKVLDFMNKKNQEYLENYNKGGAYKHIGFEEAYYMLPDTRQQAARQVAQKQEDTERKQKADRVSGNTGLSNLEIKKPTVPRGTTLQQIADYYESIL